MLIGNSVLCPPQEEQAAKLKAEKIRVALEKIKEAQVKKVNYLYWFIRVFILYLFSWKMQGKFFSFVSITFKLP